MKRPDAASTLITVFVALAGVLIWRGESAAAVVALATAAAFYWAVLALKVSDVKEVHQRELHELRLALATLGDPDALLHRLDELQARAEKLAKTPERLEELTERVKKTGGDAHERLVKLEAFVSRLLTDEGFSRRLKFRSGE